MPNGGWSPGGFGWAGYSPTGVSGFGAPPRAPVGGGWTGQQGWGGGMPYGAAGFNAIEAALGAGYQWGTGYGGAFTAADLAKAGTISPLGRGWNISQGLLKSGAITPDVRGNIRTPSGLIPYSEFASYIQSPEGMSWLGTMSSAEIASMAKGTPYRGGEGERFFMYEGMPRWNGKPTPPPMWSAEFPKEERKTPFLAAQKPEPRTVIGRRPYQDYSRLVPPTRWLTY